MKNKVLIPIVGIHSAGKSTILLERSKKLHSKEDIDQYYSFYQRLETNISLVLKLLGFHYQEFNTMKPLNETLSEVSNFLFKIREDII